MQEVEASISPAVARDRGVYQQGRKLDRVKTKNKNATAYMRVEDGTF